MTARPRAKSPFEQFLVRWLPQLQPRLPSGELFPFAFAARWVLSRDCLTGMQGSRGQTAHLGCPAARAGPASRTAPVPWLTFGILLLRRTQSGNPRRPLAACRPALMSAPWHRTAMPRRQLLQDQTFPEQHSQPSQALLRTAQTRTAALKHWGASLRLLAAPARPAALSQLPARPARRSAPGARPACPPRRAWRRRRASTARARRPRLRTRPGRRSLTC